MAANSEYEKWLIEIHSKYVGVLNILFISTSYYSALNEEKMSLRQMKHLWKATDCKKILHLKMTMHWSIKISYFWAFIDEFSTLLLSPFNVYKKIIYSWFDLTAKLRAKELGKLRLLSKIWTLEVWKNQRYFLTILTQNHYS